MRFIVKAREKKEKVLRERYGDEPVDLILGFAKKHESTMRMDILESILRLIELRKRSTPIQRNLSEEDVENDDV